MRQTCIVPKLSISNSEMIATWEAKEKTEAQQIINYLNSPEGQKYVVKLYMEDGR
jgi:ABC-type Fe3+ transport system substrate-binding protein